MEVAQFVRVSSVVDFLRLEQFLHGTCDLCDVGHEEVTLLIIKFIKVVDMMVVSDEASSAVGLLLEKEDAGNAEMADLNHEIVKSLVVLAIETVFWVRVHIIGDL